MPGVGKRSPRLQLMRAKRGRDGVLFRYVTMDKTLECCDWRMSSLFSMSSKPRLWRPPTTAVVGVCFPRPLFFLIQHEHSHIKSQARCGDHFRQVYAPADDLTAADASASRRRSTIKGSSRVLPGDQREGEVAERQARAYPVSILAVY